MRANLGDITLLINHICLGYTDCGEFEQLIDQTHLIGRHVPNKSRQKLRSITCYVFIRKRVSKSGSQVVQLRLVDCCGHCHYTLIRKHILGFCKRFQFGRQGSSILLHSCDGGFNPFLVTSGHRSLNQPRDNSQQRD